MLEIDELDDPTPDELEQDQVIDYDFDDDFDPNFGRYDAIDDRWSGAGIPKWSAFA